MNPQLDAAGMTFGQVLAYLRKRARLTQGELGREVGYSREQITRLERNQRAPDAAVIAARFVPALGLEDEPALAARLIELARGDIPQVDAPPPVTQLPRKLWHNLPAPLLPLVGRASELHTLVEQVQDDARLLTLVGAAGVGKTRLALQVTRESAARFRDGVCFVSLAPIEDPQLVPAAIYNALHPGSNAASDLTALLFETLGELELLLVLDNFEQLLTSRPPAPANNHSQVGDAGLFVSDLLTRAPGVKILVTSRAPLNLYGEFLFPVAPLLLPTLDAAYSSTHEPLELDLIPSVALFVARARQVNPAFRLTRENADDVAALCVRLDGLPLALELAAAQLRHFSLPQLRRGLAEHAVVLEFAARNVPERHHSLTNALAWSYDSLAPDEQRVFEWLGVFAGGATVAQLVSLNIAANVAAALAELKLVNLVQTETVGKELRYTLFATVRQFARAKLRARGVLDTAEQRHAEHFLALAEEIEPHLTGAEQQAGLDRLERERDNLRHALAWALRDGEARSGAAADQALSLRLCNALWKFWRYRCALAEGYDWTTRALLATPESEAMLDLRAGAEWGAGVLAAVMQRDADANAHLQESLRLWQIVEDDMGVAAALTALGARAMERGEYEQAASLQQQALSLYTQLDDAAAMAYARNALGETFRMAGALTASKAQYEASLELARQAGHERSRAVAQSNLASVEIALGDLAAARVHLLASLQVFISLDDRVNIASCLATIACIESQTASSDALVRAVQLLSFATHMIQDAGGKFEAADARDFNHCITQCRAHLGPDAFARAWTTGQTLTLSQAIAMTAVLS